MELINGLKNIAAKIERQKDIIQTEEATKNAFIMPFIATLGYDIFDPTEVVPEYTADIGTKKGEKVDYALMINGEPMVIFECKKCGSDLIWENASQLYRYYAANSKTKIGVLTNGIVYQLYTDLEEQNVLDKKPFLELNMLDIQEPIVHELRKFSKSLFNIDEILSSAAELKYMKLTKRIIAEQLNSPDEEFVKFFASQMYTGVKTQKVMQQFTEIVRKGLNQFINERINDRLKSAMTGEVVTIIDETPLDLPSIPENNGIVTTQEEIESFYVIKALSSELIDVNRLSIKDYKNLCNIIIDGSSFKAVAKLYYNSNKKFIGFYDEKKQEVKYPIDNIDDIYNYKNQLLTSISVYLTEKAQDQ